MNIMILAQPTAESISLPSSIDPYINQSIKNHHHDDCHESPLDSHFSLHHAHDGYDGGGGDDDDGHADQIYPSYSPTKQQLDATTIEAKAKAYISSQAYTSISFVSS